MPSVLTSHAYQAMLDKLRSSDPDFRCMAIIDFQKEAKQPNYRIEEPVEKELFKEILKLVIDDTNIEVKNMGAQCLATLTQLATKPGNIISAVDSLLKYSATDEEAQRDIATLSLKNMLVELGHSRQFAAETVDKVVQGVCKQLQTPGIATQHAVELLDILSLIYTQFAAIISAKPALQSSSLSVLLLLLSNSRPHIRKRSIHAIGQLIPSASNETFETLSQAIVSVFSDGSDEDMETEEESDLAESVKRTAYSGLVGTLGKTSPAKIGKVLESIIPGILALSELTEDEEALEASMMTLETLVVRCPVEIAPFLGQITKRATVLLKYDPNYAGDEDDDMEGSDAEEEDDDDDEFDEEYSDDEDASWKARRSAAKLLQALISTRGELLSEWYSSVGPLLTSRLSEREESVRVEIFAAWETILKQTAVLRTVAPPSTGQTPSDLKRKRLNSEAGNGEIFASPLDSQILSLTKATLKQSIHKSLLTKEKSFNLLNSVVKLSPGCLDGQSAFVVANIQKALSGVSSSSGTNGTALIIAVLSFLGTFVSSHTPRVYAPSLSQLVDSIIGFTGDKYQRVSLEALVTVGKIAKALRPITPDGILPLSNTLVGPIQKLFEAVCEIIGGIAADAEVKDRALYALGDLLIHEGDVLAPMFDRALPLITARLATEANQLSALSVVGMIAGAPTCTGVVVDKWLIETLEQLSSLFRRCTKQNRGKALAVLSKLVTRFGSDLPLDAATELISELKSYITVQDLHNLGITVECVTKMLQAQPSLRPTVESAIMPAITEAIKSPLLHDAAIESIKAFLAVYVSEDPESARHLIPELTKSLMESTGGAGDVTGSHVPSTEDGATQAFATLAKCIGTIVENSPSTAAGIINEFVKPVKKGETGADSQLYLSLLVLGEIGRSTDFSKTADVVTSVLKLFDASSEQIKSAAAFAAGNIAVGNTATFLPVIVKGVAQAKVPATRLLYLHALKEAIVHCSVAQVSGIADSLWEPLLRDDGEGQDDGARNVKAACIGKLITSNPSKYIPELSQRLGTASPIVKATIVASTRYTLTEVNTACDEVLAATIYDFLALMQDSDHIVRRLAVSSTNAAGQYKPYLIMNHLPTLLPMIYAETEVKQELIREYQMGPFTVKMDDGLNNRKGAFEALQTLLNTSFAMLNVNDLFNIILSGLADGDEVKLLALMMLGRLAIVSDSIVASRLDELVESIENITKPVIAAKDETEQDVQRKVDSQKTAINCIAPLAALSTAHTSPKFDKMIGDLSRSDKWSTEFAISRK